MSRGEVAETFGVSLSTIKRYLRLEREGGGLAPKPSPGRPPKIGPEQHPHLEAQLREHDTATLSEHARMWEQRRGVRVSIFAMSRAIERLGWTRKKGRWAPQRGMSAPGPSGG
jgi:transposase